MHNLNRRDARHSDERGADGKVVRSQRSADVRDAWDASGRKVQDANRHVDSKSEDERARYKQATSLDEQKQ